MNLRLVAAALVCITWMSCISDDGKLANGPLAPGQKKEKPDPATVTSIQWIDSVKNMGNVLEGTQVEVLFKFINTGSKPLVIESAQPSCGCTVPSKPEDPILPGKEGEIKAIFNSQGRTGANHKTITVNANTAPASTHLLEFNVNVLGKAEGPKAASSTPEKF